MITIRKPLSFSEIGRKDNQEDYLYPQEAGVDTRVFILCDGMGGHDNGEVASITAGKTLGDYLSSCSSIDIPTFETGLAKAYDALDSIDTNSLKKPGTTMTCLCLNEDNYLVAHIGDSRIYHIRPSLYNPETKRGGILYQSSDHSLVNDLLKAGEITEEEARDFPQKNVITRAMQPHLAKRYKADVYMFDDIKSGDYFFLCCDGILEQLSNEMLCEILADKKTSDEQKLAAIKAICDEKTRDNYTCWLVPIDKVQINSDAEVSQIIKADAEESQSIVTQPEAIPTKSQSIRESNFIKTLTSKINLPKGILKENTISSKYLWGIAIILIALVIFFSAYLIFRNKKESKVKEVKKEHIEVVANYQRNGII